MDSDILGNLVSDLKKLIRLLLNKDYDSVEKLTLGVRLSALDMKGAIEGYGRTLRFPPEEAFHDLDIIKVENSVLPTYSLRFDFWTYEEGRSDLSLEATVIVEQEKKRLRWECDDIHVL